MIRITAEPFDPSRELASFGQDPAIGAIATFIGQVRDEHGGGNLMALTLEHYPGMTERKLAELEDDARARWDLSQVLIVHRHGRMEVGETIVLVATASGHRQAALEACQFLIDRLKTDAPFWKLEETKAGNHWVEAKTSDDTAADRWRQ
ncbi:MAG TPA: molybdenum cofactor biosynthesis protein MoaE [Stellaceae bacterium]|jgi:molybdopterin synthase catalytic subunit|nr:molybdenum cofactor biosynthesis protein MoaE [Stellaceae bacterium]